MRRVSGPERNSVPWLRASGTWGSAGPLRAVLCARPPEAAVASGVARVCPEASGQLARSGPHDPRPVTRAMSRRPHSALTSPTTKAALPAFAWGLQEPWGGPTLRPVGQSTGREGWSTGAVGDQMSRPKPPWAQATALGPVGQLPPQKGAAVPQRRPTPQHRSHKALRPCGPCVVSRPGPHPGAAGHPRRQLIR